MKEEIQLSLGELEAIKRRMAAALQLADHPDSALTMYFFDLAAVQLLSLLEQRGPSQPDKGEDPLQFWWQASEGNGKLKH